MNYAQLTSIAAALLFAGCEKKAPADGGPAAGGPPPTRVIVATAVTRPVAETLSLVGTLAPHESVELQSETEGIVQEIRFEEGQPVRKGDLLVVLDESKAAAALAEAEAYFKLSRANHERAKQLLADKLISQQEFDQAAATFNVNEAGVALKRRQLRDARIRAPFDGVMGARQVSPGQVITKSTTLTWVVDLDPIRAEVQVPERFLGELKAGQKIEFAVAAFPGRRFGGEVYFISPFVDNATRTALVKAFIPNPDGELKPGMFAGMELTLRLKDKAVVIPEAALMQSGDRTTVYVVDKEQKAQMRPVKSGVRMAGVVEITEGLGEGETVIVEGLQKTRPGGPVMPVPMTNPAKTGP